MILLTSTFVGMTLTINVQQENVQYIVYMYVCSKAGVIDYLIRVMYPLAINIEFVFVLSLRQVDNSCKISMAK